MRFIKDLGAKAVGKTGRKERFCLYECPTCLELVERRIDHIRTKNPKQCNDCSRSGNSFRKTHGMNGRKVHTVWRHMKERCLNKNDKRYDRYGGRGVDVCDEWLKFENFYRDMGDIPEKGMQIDREDNDGDYEPSNCRWVTPAENSRNRSTTRICADKVSVIKRLLLDKKYTQRSLAILFNVSNAIISQIKLGKSWADVAPYEYPLTQFNRKQEV